MINRRIFVAALLCFIIGAGGGYYLGYDHGFEKSVDASISSFEECKAAGYPIAESYPEQCHTKDGRGFVRVISPTPEEPIVVPEEVLRPEPVGPTVCTADAKVCPDGTAFGRTGPNCTFPACPGE